MSTAALGAKYSPPSSPTLHHAGNSSTVFADRPIRPLPKRRLRSRLSAEAADSILYPPESPAGEIIFQDSFNGDSTSPREHIHENSHHNERLVAGNTINELAADVKKSYQFKGNDRNSDDEDKLGAVRRFQEQHQRPPTTGNGSSRNGYIISRDDNSKYVQSMASRSTASSGDSVDGYDSFENTNNKKKRKIPTSGSLSHSSGLSTEMACMGISTARDIDPNQVDHDQDGGVGHYYGSGSSAIPAGSSGTGISGAGRGRYGRAAARRHSGRSPLGVSFNGSNSQLNGRSFYPRRDSQAVGGLSTKEATSASRSDNGIISAAIANAAALPVIMTKGQENVSLLEQESCKKAGSARTQFTFNCETASGNPMTWPGYELSSPTGLKRTAHTGGASGQSGQSHKVTSTQGTQTTSNTVNPTIHAASKQVDVAQQAPQKPKKPRRPLTKQYAVAARERRLRQDYNNYHHPPREEDVWICEFCEYESIFGSPPEALIRQYEIKDRRERRRVAEKRRLLEKAKTKGKKGKKSNKNAKNVSAAVHQPNPKAKSGQQSVEQTSLESQGARSEDSMLNGTNDSLHQMPSRIPQPISQTQNHSLRRPGGQRMNSSAVRI